MQRADTIVDSLRRQAVLLPESGIVKVMNYGRNREGLIPLWAGEGDVPTPDFISDAAYASLQAGETFYTNQRGIPSLREALAAYHLKHYERDMSPEHFFVTGSGMQAIQIAIQAVAGSGDEVVIPTPAWPNAAAAVQILGARPVSVPLEFSTQGWRLDIDRMMRAVGPRTRAIVINTPGNPTGWVATREDIAAIIEFARARRIWVIADEVYGRYFYDGPRAPSFLDVMEPCDRVLLVNTFSKNWAMTGWRMGWVQAPVEIGQVLENLIQYNTSGVATFMQQAGIQALNEGEAFVAEQIERARRGRAIACEALARFDRVRFEWPPGAFYALFSIEGEDDTERLAHRLVDEANIGLAPGTAFGSGGEHFLRLCFARSSDSLEVAMSRLSDWIERQAR